ncbi:hypothetical protein H6P81_006432 [Aristolochia fimbriata]|uniref:Aminotransferase-like plant mobile domain-containing protein n=1 Tax=Aristolochia fimbriata TaxID=158543 RepID=A0AAV7F1U7_ARIFI|nr:hypothetical protein H6P81_006432 [Aristolochia fimbriata]
MERTFLSGRGYSGGESILTYFIALFECSLRENCKEMLQSVAEVTTLKEESALERAWETKFELNLILQQTQTRQSKRNQRKLSGVALMAEVTLRGGAYLDLLTIPGLSPDRVPMESFIIRETLSALGRLPGAVVVSTLAGSVAGRKPLFQSSGIKVFIRLGRVTYLTPSECVRSSRWTLLGYTPLCVWLVILNHARLGRRVLFYGIHFPSNSIVRHWDSKCERLVLSTDAEFSILLCSSWSLSIGEPSLFTSDLLAARLLAVVALSSVITCRLEIVFVLMSSPSDSTSFLGLVLPNVQATVRGVRQDYLRIGDVKGDRRPLVLPLWRPSAFGGCDVHVPLVKATCEFWSHPVVDEDDQICYLPGVGEASSSPHQTKGAFLLSPTHDNLVCFSTPELFIDRNRNAVNAFMEVWCSSTNSIFTREGELSISLWDMHQLGGLPLPGSLFDETFPSVEDFLQCCFLQLPESLKYFILAYYRLFEPLEVDGFTGLQISEWASFWFHPKEGIQPSEDPWADRKKTSGLTSRDRSSWLNQPLVELEVPDALADEVYLAAFLSLWICHCILPMPGGMLRFTIFKMAYYLANGQKCNLAVATLANLYRGLNSSTCGRIPWPFVYTWLAQRFGVHGADPSEVYRPLMMIYRNPDRCHAYTKKEARELFWRSGVQCWYPSQALPPGLIVDKPGHYASRIEVDYFQCLRATRLVLRQRDLLIVEPYSPNYDQQRAASVEALVEIWQAGSVFPLGTVEVPPSVSPSSDPGVTALFRESWLETIVPLFEREWQNFTGESAPKKKTMPKRATVKRKAAGSKAAMKTANTLAPEMPTQGMRLRSGLRKPLTPLRNVHPRTVPAHESREKVLEASPVDGSVAPSVEETAVEQRAMLVYPLPIRLRVAEESPCPSADALAIVLSPRVDQPTLRAEDSLSPIVSGEHQQLGWIGEEAPTAVVAGKLVAGEAECPMTISSDNEASSHPSVGEVGVEFSSPASDVGHPATSTPEEGPFTRNRPGNEGVTLDVGEEGLQPGRRPVSENSSTSRFISSSSLPLSAMSREWVQQSALGLWTRFVRSILAPAEDPCSPKLVADAHGFLEHLRGAGVETSILEQWVEDFAREADHLQQLRDSAVEKLSWSERHIVEAAVHPTALCEAERETTESERAALHERLAVVEARLDSAAARIASARAKLDGIEGEASVLEGRLNSLRARPVLSEAEARNLDEVHAEVLRLRQRMVDFEL